MPRKMAQSVYSAAFRVPGDETGAYSKKPALTIAVLD
jgi:hypothetical protein